MVDNPYGLRVAVPADAEALLAFVLPIYEEDAAQPVSVVKVAAIVARCIARDRAIAGIVTGPHGIEASVGATIDVFDYSDEPHAMVKWLGVAPAFRKSDRAARMVSYVRWLYETMASMEPVPVPVFLPALTTSEQRRKVLLYQRRAPQVGVLYAFGCLPDRSFFNPGRAGPREGGLKEDIRSPPLVRPSVPSIPASTG
jgi:hypothetical protein